MFKNLLILILCLCHFSYAQKIGNKKVYIKDSVYMSLINPFIAPVEFTFTPKDSVKGQFKVKQQVLFEPKATVKDVFVFPLSMIKDTAKIVVSDFVETRGTYGNSKTAKHDVNYRYTLPYPKGKKYKIIQTFGGTFSHSGTHSKYAIDFALRIGDTITAAREGLIISIKEDSKEYGRTRKYADKGNRVVIMHNDGTFASYVHLDYNGALVEVGGMAAAGQAIGISGMTGFTTTAHLHLVILAPKGISVPFYFKNYQGKTLKQGKRYKRKI